MEGAPAPFAALGGEMARRVREFDWSATPLGPIRSWPPELKTTAGFVLESQFPAAVVWGPEFVTLYNDAFRPILGDKPEALGRSFAEVWAESWDEIGPIAARAFAGESTFIENFPLTVDRFGKPEQAWFTFSYSPVRRCDGAVLGMVDTVVETTGAVQARAELQLLTRELEHRLKNTLMIVQAIAEQTLKNIQPRDAAEAFADRLAALGRAHDILIRQGWSALSLAEVARTTLEALDGRRQIAVDGPDLRIGARTAVTLSMLLHELATNAIKHGALSTPDGRVVLSWTLAEKRLRMRWRESGGPQVREPSRTGFGSRLIAAGLGGAVERRYPASGFEADLETPLDALSA